MSISLIIFLILAILLVKYLIKKFYRVILIILGIYLVYRYFPFILVDLKNILFSIFF